jgi:hypothetical protein
MPPTHECLATHDGAGTQVDLRLEACRQRSALDRGAKLGDERHPVEARRVTIGVVPPPRAPVVLRLVHRDIGALQQLLGRLPVRGVARDAHAAFDRESQPVGRDRLAQQVQQFLCREGRRIRAVQLWQ